LHPASTAATIRPGQRCRATSSASQAFGAFALRPTSPDEATPYNHEDAACKSIPRCVAIFLGPTSFLVPLGCTPFMPTVSTAEHLRPGVSFFHDLSKKNSLILWSPQWLLLTAHT